MGRLINYALLIIAVIFLWWQLEYGTVRQLLEVYKPQPSGYSLVQKQIEVTAAKAASDKAAAAQKEYARGDIATGDRLTSEAYANLDHEICIAHRNCGNGSTGLSSAPPPPSPTASGTRLDTPTPRVVELDKDKEWSVVFPANLEYRTGILVRAGQKVTFVDWIGQVKLDPRETFTNQPAGSFDTSRAGLAFVEPFVSSLAWVGALLARVGDQPYSDVGGRQSNSFIAAGDGEVILSVNCLQGERHNASGHYDGVVEVQ